jgi:type II pantothenate kinase
LIVGIDVGASTTKGVLLHATKIVDVYSIPTKDAEVSALTVLKHFIDRVSGDYERIGLVAVSGGGSRKFNVDLLDLPTKKVDEINAIGLGGLILTGRQESLIVSVGTGTALVAAYDGGKRISHIGGTGVGGGTILGLSKRILNIDDFEVVEDMASRGDANKVDLTVADIVGGSVGIIPGYATASNFGKISGKASKEDVAAGIFNMVSQVIGVISVMAAKAFNLDNIILVGRLVKSKIVSRIIFGTTELFEISMCVPKNCEYCTAIGAAGLFKKP